jgi:hypothetical protein
VGGGGPRLGWKKNKGGGQAVIKKKSFRIKIGFLNLSSLWKFVEGDLGGILTLGLSRILEKKYNMPCHAMHPIQNLFLESFSYVLQFDMHFYMHSYLRKSFYSCKKVGVTASAK